MRIAYLSTEYPPVIYGGLGVYVQSISEEIVSTGEDVAVFALGSPDLERHEKMEGVDVYREVPVPMKDGLRPFLSPETLAWGEGLSFLMDFISYNGTSASRIMETGPYDICVAQDWLSLPGGMAVKRKGIPLIYHVHGLEIGRSKSPNPQIVRLEKAGAEVSDLVITVSGAMKDELIGMGVPSEKIRVCYHGVNSEFFDPGSVDPDILTDLRSNYGISGDDTVILFVGRLEPVKGVMQLLQAMPGVWEEHPEARLLIVGMGTLEDEVRDAAKRLGRVTLVTEFISPEAKMHHYALADLCVFPSLYEPFGIVGLEAAAMGKPAVVGASGTSGLREIVCNPAEPEPTGVHVDPRRPEDIAWGINLALEDRERLRVWGRNARERAVEKFTWEEAARCTLRIYREAVTSPR